MQQPRLQANRRSKSHPSQARRGAVGFKDAPAKTEAIHQAFRRAPSESQPRARSEEAAFGRATAPSNAGHLLVAERRPLLHAPTLHGMRMRTKRSAGYSFRASRCLSVVQEDVDSEDAPTFSNMSAASLL